MAECSAALALSPLSSIPREMRDHIYQAALSPAKAGIALLLTCRQIYAEAREQLFKRPLSFESQTDFVNWTDLFDVRHLRNVRSICIRLQEVDVSHLLQQAIHVGSPGAGLQAWGICERSVQKLLGALAAVQSTRELTVIQPARQRSHLTQELHRRFLFASGIQLGHLESLTFTGELVSLSFLYSMKNLQTLRCTGYSLSTPQETLEILSGLPKLRHVEILSHFQSPSADYELLPGMALQPFRSITGEVLAHTAPLRSFVYTSRGGDSGPSRSPVDADLFMALRQSHLDTLQRVQISLDGIPDDNTLGLISQLRHGSSLHHFQLSWPGKTITL